MSFQIFYHQDVVREDIAALSSVARKQIKQAIESKLTTRPEQFGKPLRRSLKNYRKLRVSDYRVIFRLEKNRVIIFAIQHRSVIYQKILKRIP